MEENTKTKGQKEAESKPAQVAQVAEIPSHADSNSISVFGSEKNFVAAQRMAISLSSSSIVPEIYRGKEGIANCIIALEMANRIKASVMMIMQNLYIVHGNPGFSSKFLISCLNSCGRFTPLRYEFKGEIGSDQWSCRAYATDRTTGEVLYGSWVSIEIAKKEGWYGKTGSKWQTMPELMLQYRSAAFFQRVYAPEISMGMQTAEELSDSESQPKAQAPKGSKLPKDIIENAMEVKAVKVEEDIPAGDDDNMFGNL